MAIVLKTAPSRPNPIKDQDDWDKTQELITMLFLGNNGPILRVVGGNIVKGSVFQIGGAVYYADADTAITGSASDYVKITPAGATASAAYVADLSEVSWNDEYNGYVDASGNLYVFDETIAISDGELSDYKRKDGQWVKIFGDQTIDGIKGFIKPPFKYGQSGFFGGTSAGDNVTSGGAIGNNAEATTGGAVGDSASATTGGAVGDSATATNGGGAVGNSATATTGGAVGNSASATTGGGAVGNSASATGGGGVGYSAIATNGGAVGESASATIGGAVGYSATATTGGAVGDSATATSGGAVGEGASATSGGAVGYDASATYGGAVGNSATATSDGGAVGYNASAATGGAVGYNAIATNGGAVGESASASGPGRSAFGANAVSTANNQIRIGTATETIVDGNGTTITSDERDKTDIEDNDLGLEFILKVPTKKFRKNPRELYFKREEPKEALLDDEGNIIEPAKRGGRLITDEKHRPLYDEEAHANAEKKGARFHRGVIAQEIEALFDTTDFSAVKKMTVKDPDAFDEYAVNYTEFIAPLIKAVQELSEEVKVLKEEIVILKGEE